MKQVIHNISNQVICDVCNADWTNRQESGGFIFGSYGYCPDCAKKSLPRIKSYGEEHYIKAFCPVGMSFADFVRDYRGGDGVIKVITFDTHKEFVDYIECERKRK